jgi:hypothetical protein
LPCAETTSLIVRKPLLEAMLQLNNGELLKILQKKRCRIANFEDFVVIFVLF